MIERLADKISGCIVSEGICPEGDREVLAYGLCRLFKNTEQAVLLSALALLLGTLPHMAVFCAFYCILRRKCGGAHAKTHRGCMAVFTSLALGVMLAVISAPARLCRPAAATLAAFSLIAVYVRAPVTHPKIPKGEQALARCKKQGRVIVTLETAIIAVCCIAAPERANPLIFCAGMGVGLAGLMLIPSPDRRGGEVK